MRWLGDTLGEKLFGESEKSTQLNQLGREFVPKSQAVVLAYNIIIDDLTGNPLHVGEFPFGAVPSFLLTLVIKSINSLMELYSQLHIRVVPDISPKLLE